MTVEKKSARCGDVDVTGAPRACAALVPMGCGLAAWRVSVELVVTSGAATERMALQAGATQATAHAVPYRLASKAAAAADSDPASEGFEDA